MKFALNITCNNDAFQPDAASEVIRILRDVANRMEQGDGAEFYRTIFDINGNDVGRFKLAERL
jgi:hypothetical protein